MGIKHYRPITPSTRNMSGSTFEEITKKTPEKKLLAKKKKKSGRNSYGRITVRHQGGGNRQKYRIIDFKRLKDDMFANVIGIEYDPNRSANIALIEYEDGERAYILAPIGLKDGDKVVSGVNSDIKVGNCLPIENIPVGTMIYNQESIDILKGNVKLINHVHISEPYLKSIEKRELHAKLADVLYKEGYDGFISIEMGNVSDLSDINAVLEYISSIM